ncbi:MAG: AAA family ATPase [Novosphingobium sp.]|nr:AAA family ATPase [Novosphingobium sp.]
MEASTDRNPFIEEQRQWLVRFKEEADFSWPQLAKRIGRPAGTLSQFGSAKGYNGDELGVAEKVNAFRQSLEKQRALAAELPEVPGFFRTETTDRLEYMLRFAQMGQMVAAALEAGCSKTETAQAYTRKTPNVFYVELRKSAGVTNNMLKMVLEAMGVKDPKGGTFDMSAQVCEILRKCSKPLIIFDEAQHLTEASLEEIRSWPDTLDGARAAITGIAFFGNIGILQKLARYAQLSSRIRLRHEQRTPMPADIEALADAWGVSDEASRKQLHVVCSRLGGLRTAEDVPLALDHLEDAWAELDFRAVAA